jgi:hypothetical protein
MLPVTPETTSYFMIFIPLISCILKMSLSHLPENQEKSAAWTFYRTYRRDWILRYSHMFDHQYQSQEYFDWEWDNIVSEDEKAEIDRMLKTNKFRKAQSLNAITRKPDTSKYYDYVEKGIREHI